MVDGVNGRLNVSVKYSIHPMALYSDFERTQRTVLAASLSKPV
jgi:hypothetical protein